LVDRVIKFWEATGRDHAVFKGKPPIVSDPEASLRERARARSILFAQEAARTQEVSQFRAELLGGRLLSPEGLQVWIREQEVADGPATRYALVALPAKTRLSGEIRVPSGLNALRLEARLLVYGVPESRIVRRVPTARNGVLERLRRVAEWL